MEIIEYILPITYIGALIYIMFWQPKDRQK